MQAVWMMTRVFCCLAHKSCSQAVCSWALMVMKGFAFLSLLLTDRPTRSPSFLTRRANNSILRLWFPHTPALFCNQISELHLVMYETPVDGRDHSEGFVQVGPRSSSSSQRRGCPITRQHLEPHQLRRFVQLVLGVLKMSSWRPNCRGVWRCDNEADASQETLSENNGEHMRRSTISVRRIQIWSGVKMRSCGSFSVITSVTRVSVFFAFEIFCGDDKTKPVWSEHLRICMVRRCRWIFYNATWTSPYILHGEEFCTFQFLHFVFGPHHTTLPSIIVLLTSCVLVFYSIRVPLQ